MSQRATRARVEAHLCRHRGRVALLVLERLFKDIVGDVGVTLRVARDADLGERVAEFVHGAQQVQAIMELALVLRVAADDEHLRDVGRARAIEQLLEVRTVAREVRRQMRRHVVAASGKPLAQVERRLDAVTG